MKMLDFTGPRVTKKIKILNRRIKKKKNYLQRIAEIELTFLLSFFPHIYTLKPVQQRSLKIIKIKMLDLDRATCYKKKIKVLNRRIKKKIIICNVSLIYKNWTGISSFLLSFFTHMYTRKAVQQRSTMVVLFLIVLSPVSPILKRLKR